MLRTFDADVIGGVTTAAKNGTIQVLIEFRLPDGSKFSDYLAVTDRALPYTIEKLRTCGWTGDDLENLSSIAGTRVEIVVDDEEYNGETRVRLKFINPAGGRRVAPATGAGQAWRDKIRALRGDGTQPKAGGVSFPD